MGSDLTRFIEKMLEENRQDLIDYWFKIYDKFPAIFLSRWNTNKFRYMWE